MSSPLSVIYEDKITKYAAKRFACLSLCNEGCRFVEYSENGPQTGVCDLYYLKDSMFGSLKKIQIATGYIKVYPGDKVFVGIPDHLNWNRSQQNCESLGWRLASAESSLLLDRTKTLMKNNHFWLGATQESGVWRWISGVVMSTPPTENYNTCLLIWYGSLDDASCGNDLNPHVCEIIF
ncbi:hypothetical protein DPMN_151227 [Dreissena polymorpha]|uniref:C-type lectin domain-containing protein n=1 Tax=Dreissena polymorpha TaxID=45954 RepID=A0A9D4J6R5_DREPO|nr:hypothetical protein DPMN_151227 [Dreissena polymorpha]